MKKEKRMLRSGGCEGKRSAEERRILGKVW